MKNCNDNHLQKANQGSNFNKMGDKMNANIFNSKRLRKTCYRFLSSIITLSIMSVANSSFAFPAKVRENQTLFLFYAPARDYKGENTYSNPKLQLFTKLIDYTLVDVLYCRSDKWCYISGYYSLGNQNTSAGYYPEKAWALSDDICDPEKNDRTNPLPFCGINNTKLEGILISGKQFNDFFCGTETYENKQVINPWRWLLQQGNSNFCGDLKP